MGALAAALEAREVSGAMMTGVAVEVLAAMTEARVTLTTMGVEAGDRSDPSSLGYIARRVHCLQLAKRY